MPSKPLAIEALVRIPYVWDYDLSPDGQQAAIVWDKPGQNDIYLVRLDGAARPRRITTGPESKAAPHFSPDGRYLAYAQDYGGDEAYDIFLYDRRTGTARNLTPDTPAEIINPDVAWSPGASHVAFVSNRAGSFATYVLPVEGDGPARRLTQHGYSDIAASWSPDGRHVAVTALAQGQETWIFIVPAQGGAATPIGNERGPIDAHSPRWSPDGRRLAFVSGLPGIETVFVYDLDTQALRQVTAETHEASEPAWSPDGRRLAYTWNVDGNVCLGLRDLVTDETVYVQVGPGVHSDPRFTPDGRRLLALFSSADQPNDLWALNAGGRGRRPRPQQLTRSRPARYTGREFVQPRVVRWQSDGLAIAGLLYVPRGFRRRPGAATNPAVVWVHGGPTWQFKNEWYIAVQQLVSAGLVVLAPNYRGSMGYGRAFQEANRFDLGGGDMRDVIAGAEYLVREGYAARDRLGITGASYGGYLTMTALTRYPEVFAAGSAIVPFINWFTEHASEREDLQYWDEQNFGHPERDAERYRAYSPYFYLENIAAPVQMIAGANDQRCPAAEVEQAAAVLKDLDVPHEIVIYPDEGHSFHKLPNRLDSFRRRVAFLKRYLGAGGRRRQGRKGET